MYNNTNAPRKEVEVITS